MNARPARDPEFPGVFDASSTDGYVTLIVRGPRQRILLALDIATDCYSPIWVDWLERWARLWARRRARRAIRLLK